MDNRKKILLVVLVLGFIGLYYSKTVLSVFPYLILILGLTQPGAVKKLKSFKKSLGVLTVFLIFFIYVISGVNSTNTTMWLGRLNTNLIYLVIPLGLYLLGPYDKKFVDKVLELFVLVNFFISIYLLTNYFIHFDEINNSYLKGQTIHTPIIHVRYSYFVALAIVFSVYLFLNVKDGLQKYYLGFVALFLIVFIHIMAVRTGIFSLYLTIVFLAFYNAFRYKKYKIAISVILGLFGLMILSYMFLPSIKNKVNYVKWDIQTTLDGTAKYHTSDRIRITSIINGFKIVNDSPLLGSGIGDIEDEMIKKYKLNYPDLPKNMRFNPINQFVFTLASMGIVGFILFYGLLLFPIFYIKGRHEILLPFYILTFSTFFGESTIELMVGKTAFLALLSLLICYEKDSVSV